MISPPDCTSTAILRLGILAMLGAASVPASGYAQRPGSSAASVERTMRPVHVVETARDDEVFGRIDCITALPDGGVAVMDAQGPNGPAVLRFGPTGRFVGQLGRKGAGPGEYGTYFLSECLTVTAKGELALHDMHGSRIVIWDLSSGRTRTVILPTRLSGLPPLVVWQPDGAVLAKVMTKNPRPGTAFDVQAYSMLRLTAKAL